MVLKREGYPSNLSLVSITTVTRQLRTQLLLKLLFFLSGKTSQIEYENI